MYSPNLPNFENNAFHFDICRVYLIYVVLSRQPVGTAGDGTILSTFIKVDKIVPSPTVHNSSGHNDHLKFDARNGTVEILYFISSVADDGLCAEVNRTRLSRWQLHTTAFLIFLPSPAWAGSVPADFHHANRLIGRRRRQMIACSFSQLLCRVPIVEPCPYVV